MPSHIADCRWQTNEFTLHIHIAYCTLQLEDDKQIRAHTQPPSRSNWLLSGGLHAILCRYHMVQYSGILTTVYFHIEIEHCNSQWDLSCTMELLKDDKQISAQSRGSWQPTDSYQPGGQTDEMRALTNTTQELCSHQHITNSKFKINQHNTRGLFAPPIST